MLEWTGERYLPWVDEPEIHYEHLHRYRFAAELVAGKRVLDLASGEGYGAHLLARTAAEVVAVDIDPAAVAHAADAYPRDNLAFIQGSMTDVPVLEPQSFDVITCFEALEHITEHEALLAEVTRLLASDGLFLVSTPDKATYSDEADYDNPYHPKELYLHEFQDLLARYFAHTRLFGQKVYPASHMFPVGDCAGGASEYSIARVGKTFSFVASDYKAPRYYVAIASEKPVPEDLGASYLLDVTKPADATVTVESATPTELPPEYTEAQKRAEAGDIDGAIAALAPLAEGPPPLAVAHNDLGVLYCVKDRKMRARRHYESAVKLEPDNAAFAKNLADLYLVGFSNTDAALELYAEVLRRDPNDGDAVLGAAQANLLRGDHQVAAGLFRRLMEIRPETRDEVEKTLATLEPVIARSPTASANSVARNHSYWSSYDWSQHGDEWSECWGGTEALWFGSILPRVHAALPAAHILEIAPGFGRCTQYLKDRCSQLTVVDLTQRCIDACRERFASETHINYHVNDGKSLAMIEDASIDYVFSWDSLVHAEADVVRDYLEQLAKKLKPGGKGFIHHSNIGSHRDPTTQKLSVQNLHWRGESMSAEQFRQYCATFGLTCLTQELITWGGTIFNDCISVFTRSAQPPGFETAVWENPHFMGEAERHKQIGVHYAVALPPAPDESEVLDLAPVRSHEEYWAWVEDHHHEYENRQQIEDRLAQPTDTFTVPGECFVCGERADFRVGWEFAFENYQFVSSDEPRKVPNWREWLVCPKCGLNNRMRAAVQVLEQHLRATPTSAIYITEQTTALYRWLQRKYPDLVGSEHLGDRVPRGESNEDGLRNEDLTRLTFADESFDLVLSFDVFEHVPDVEAAFRECLRVLRPGGTLLFTIPFDRTAEHNKLRARLDRNGDVEHLLEAEYHGDPLSSDGCLTFHNFGWQVLDQLAAQGFADVGANLFWSRRFAHLGGDQIVFMAHKPQRTVPAEDPAAESAAVVRLSSRPTKGQSRADGLICLYPFYFLQLFYGKAYTCCPDWTQRTLGDLRHQSILDIWNSPAAQRVREQMYRGEWQDICNPCCPHIAAFKQTGKTISLDELEHHNELNPELVADIRAGRVELSSPPTAFKIDNANTCNIDCIMCTRHALADDQRLIERTMDEIQTCLPTAKEITLCGSGEPLVIKYARHLLQGDHSSNPHLKFNLITNGLLLPRFWQRMKHQRFGTVMVSVDAATRETYEAVRVGGKWDDLQSALSLLSDQHHRFDSVTLNMTVMRQNVREMSAFIDLAESYGFDVSFQAVRGRFGDQNIFELRDHAAVDEVVATMAQEAQTQRQIAICWGDLSEWRDAASEAGAA